VAGDAAQITREETEVQPSRLTSQLELRAHTLSQREHELEEQLRAALSMLTKRDVTIAALESRLGAAQKETEDYLQRLAGLIQRAVVRHQHAPAKRASKRATPTRSLGRSIPKKRRRKGAGQRR
jgi:DNA repair exonuclease SbcCD ATPase subunit